MFYISCILKDPKHRYRERSQYSDYCLVIYMQLLLHLVLFQKDMIWFDMIGS